MTVALEWVFPVQPDHLEISIVRDEARQVLSRMVPDSAAGIVSRKEYVSIARARVKEALASAKDLMR